MNEIETNFLLKKIKKIEGVVDTKGIFYENKLIELKTTSSNLVIKSKNEYVKAIIVINNFINKINSIIEFKGFFNLIKSLEEKEIKLTENEKIIVDIQNASYKFNTIKNTNFFNFEDKQNEYEDLFEINAKEFKKIILKTTKYIKEDISNKLNGFFIKTNKENNQIEIAALNSYKVSWIKTDAKVKESKNIFISNKNLNSIIKFISDDIEQKIIAKINGSEMILKENSDLLFFKIKDNLFPKINHERNENLININYNEIINKIERLNKVIDNPEQIADVIIKDSKLVLLINEDKGSRFQEEITIENSQNLGYRFSVNLNNLKNSIKNLEDDFYWNKSNNLFLLSKKEEQIEILSINER